MGYRVAADRPGFQSCGHDPACPPADADDGEAAREVATFRAGWWLLCNGLIVFDETGARRLPDTAQDGPCPR